MSIITVNGFKHRPRAHLPRAHTHRHTYTTHNRKCVRGRGTTDKGGGHTREAEYAWCPLSRLTLASVVLDGDTCPNVIHKKRSSTTATCVEGVKFPVSLFSSSASWSSFSVLDFGAAGCRTVSTPSPPPTRSACPLRAERVYRACRPIRRQAICVIRRDFSHRVIHFGMIEDMNSIFTSLEKKMCTRGKIHSSKLRSSSVGWANTRGISGGGSRFVPVHFGDRTPTPRARLCKHKFRKRSATLCAVRRRRAAQ